MIKDNHRLIRNSKEYNISGISIHLIVDSLEDPFWILYRQRMPVTKPRWLKKRHLMEFRRRRQQSGYFLSVILWLNKLANSSRLLTVRVGRRGCDEWRWIAFLASVFVIVSSDLKTDGKKKRWIRTLTVIYMSLYGKKEREKK